MINPDLVQQALKAMHGLVVLAKDQAYQSGDKSLADFLNDLEMIPDCLADDKDRTEEFLEVLQGIVQLYPQCRSVISKIDEIVPISS